MPPADSLDSVEELKEALQVMFEFRQNWGTEESYDTVMGWSVLMKPDDCSEETNQLVDTYQKYEYAYTGPSQYLQWTEKEDFLTSIAEWLESQ